MPFTAFCTDNFSYHLTTTKTKITTTPLPPLSYCFILQSLLLFSTINIAHPIQSIQFDHSHQLIDQNSSSMMDSGGSLGNGFRLELLELVVNLFRPQINDDYSSNKQQQPKALAQRRRDPRFFGDSAALALQEEPREEGLPKEAKAPAQFSRVRTREEEERLLEEELRAEFVRVSSINDPEVTHRFRKKTYATMPRPFECYSCMSSSYQTKWHLLQKMYIAPKAFTDACDEPISRPSQIPTILCASFCVSMLEANVEAGIFVGFKYIRGCGDRILKHGFNQTAAQIYRLNQVDKCRHLPRERLFNQPRQLEIAISGDLQLCTCYGDRCNNNSPNASTANRTPFLFCQSCIFLTSIFMLLLLRS